MTDYRLKSFLSNGLQTTNPGTKEGVSVRIPTDEEIRAASIPKPTVEELLIKMNEELTATISNLEQQVANLQAMVQELGGRDTVAQEATSPAPQQDLTLYLTSKDLIRTLTASIERQNIEITNRALVSSMEQISMMREDFFKLCAGMEKKIDSMSAKDVLNSFKAYEVDMENILTDGGVFIGHFPFESLNTLHQRIVDVVLTNDPELNGKIAERLSDGYKLGDKVLFKEKVSVYKYTEQIAPETVSEAVEAQPEAAPTEPEAAPASEPEPAPAEPPKTKTTSRKKRTSKAEKTNKTEEEE
jgi:molecular chaperone GrpE (heat shock protein)